MVKRPCVPKAAEIIQINFNPVRGHEQANLRAAIVLSPQGYNDKTGLLVCVPCTQTIRHNPFGVAIHSLPAPGVALADQLRTLEWRAAIDEIEDARQDYGETRFICYGMLGNRMVVVCYTPRGAARHVFSMRKANTREQAHYGPTIEE